jgi:dolichyl-phosphate beta-glucosyltransferase
MPAMPEMSVVIPAYNEAVRIVPTLHRILEYLRGRTESFEVLVVDDGSEDDTSGVVRSFEAPEIVLLRLPENRGKGAALRTGVMASQGDKVLVTDADLSTPIEETRRLSQQLEAADVVIGSRALSTSKTLTPQAGYRSLMGKTFNLILRLLGVTGFKDTQCGFKLFSGAAARDLFADLTIEGFAYDVEMLWLAKRRNYRIVEIGITWAHIDDSRVNPVTDSLDMLWDVLRFRWRHRGR